MENPTPSKPFRRQTLPEGKRGTSQFLQLSTRRKSGDHPRILNPMTKQAVLCRTMVDMIFSYNSIFDVLFH